MAEYACEDIKVHHHHKFEMNLSYNFMTRSTDEIQQILIKSLSDLISLENPNYQYDARLLTF